MGLTLAASNWFLPRRIRMTRMLWPIRLLTFRAPVIILNEHSILKAVKTLIRLWRVLPSGTPLQRESVRVMHYLPDVGHGGMELIRNLGIQLLRRLTRCRRLGRRQVWMRLVTVTVVPFCVKMAVRQRSASASLKTARSPAVLAVTVETEVMYSPVFLQGCPILQMILTACPAVTPVWVRVTVMAARLLLGVEAVRSFHSVSLPITAQPVVGAVSPVTPAVHITRVVMAGVVTTSQVLFML